MRIWPWSVIADLRKRDKWKSEEIIKLQRADSQFVKDYRAAQNQIEYLVRTIRDMDEQIFKMSQLGSWEDMRPHFNYLNEGMITRKRMESDRINSILNTELIKTYNIPKMIENK